MSFRFDLETCLIRPGLQHPPPVCASYMGGAQAQLVPTGELQSLLICLEPAWSERIVGVNVAFDLAVLMTWIPGAAELVWAAYDEGRVWDCGIAERCRQICSSEPAGRWGLAAIAARYGFPHALTKDAEDGSPRLDYGRLFGLPLSEYPERHRIYALRDAEATAWVYDRQPPVDPEDMAKLARKAFGLELVRAAGMITDPEAVARLTESTEKDLNALRDFAQKHGLVRANGSKDTAVVKARVVAAYGGELKAPKAKRSKSAKDKTKPLSISIATETLERAPDPVLQQFAAWGKLTKLAGTDLPVLRAPIVHTSFGLADTLRTTSRKPNIQNWGKKSGVRGCFDPRPGNVFIIVDYSAIEAATFAQIQLDLFGDSQIAEFYNQGAAADMHSRTGAGIRGCSYDEFLARKKEPEFDAVRQAAKIAIFTRFGGGGPNAIEHGARNTYRVYKTLEEWTTIVKAIDSAWPEIPRYHSYISRVLPKRTTGVDEETGKKIVKRRTWIPGTKLFRPSCGYCDACNTPFQSLAALITGEATYQIERAVWRRELPVGTLVDNVVHDEIVAEAPEAAAEEAKARIETIMVEVGRQLAPKLLIRVEGKIARKWSK